MKNTYLLLSIILLLFSCKKETTDEKYTDLILEDSAIQAFFKANPENEKIKKEVKNESNVNNFFTEFLKYENKWLNNEIYLFNNK